MKILVFGCNGMAGHLIALYFKERGHDILGFDLRPSSLVPSVAGNAMDPAAVQSALDQGPFDAVINCIGLLNQFAENNHAGAAYLNAYFPHQLAKLTEDTPAMVVHMSTDCVFSGKRGQYTEDDLPDGATFYDRSKALGELVDGKNLTLRQSIVGPDINPRGIGLLNWFMQQPGPVSGFTGALWTGQTTLQLAKTMEAAIAARAHGLVNMVPDTWISKCDLLKLFSTHMRGGAVEVLPVDKMAADKSLKRTRFEFDYRIPGYPQMVAELADWMRAHKALYPHYPL